MRRTVILGPAALQDLEALFTWIGDRSGVRRAEIYTDRLKAYCNSFELFAERGTLREDFEPGLRIIGFERRVTIAFTVTEDEVQILRLLYGGRDLGVLTDEQDA